MTGRPLNRAAVKPERLGGGRKISPRIFTAARKPGFSGLSCFLRSILHGGGQAVFERLRSHQLWAIRVERCWLTAVSARLRKLAPPGALKSGNMILDNKEAGHFEKLQALVAESDEILIASPFLARDISVLLNGLGVSDSIRKATLLTVLGTFDQALDKPALLSHFFSYCTNNKINARLLINERLHSKIYLFKRSGKAHQAVVTSANFTRKGLNENHETGVAIGDSSSLDAVEAIFFDDYYELTPRDVEKIKQAAESHKKNWRKEKKRSPDFDPWAHIDMPADIPRPYPNCDYYIKPMGWSGDHYDQHEPIDTKLHFSKITPHVCIGDILICYAVGPNSLLGYYEIITEPERDEASERWPWFVMGKCLSPAFSARFWETGLTLSKAASDYRKSFPGEPLTAAGNDTLNALMYGKDKLKLDGAFADYLISQISLSDKSLRNAE